MSDKFIDFEELTIYQLQIAYRQSRSVIRYVVDELKIQVRDINYELPSDTLINDHRRLLRENAELRARIAKLEGGA